MNRHLTTLTGMVALLAGATSSMLADYPSTVSSLNPIAYWRLGETVQPPTADSAVNLGSLGDSAIGYYLGTALHPVGGALAGSTDSAAAFDGTANSVMRVPHQTAINPAPPFSAEVWLSPAVELSGTTLTCAISLGQFASPTRTGWLVYQSATGWNFRMYNANGLNTSVNITGGGVPVAGNWYHLVATYDGAVAKLYVNGVKTAEAAQTSYVPGASGGLAIGGRADSAFWWNGLADEMALYPSVLSDAEIASHYANGINPAPAAPYQSLVLASNPLCYYRLNENTYTPPTTLPVASNSAASGAIYDALYYPGMKVAAPGPQPPAQSGFAANNTGGSFNGSAGHVGTPLQLNDVTEFSISGWIRRGAFKSGRGGYFGQNNLIEFGDQGGGANIELWLSARGNILTPFPFADNEWGHFVVTGDLTKTVLYANGVEIGRLTGNIQGYGFSDFFFNIGGGGVFNDTGDYFQGNIDEVAVFGTALTAAQVQSLYFSANVAPKITKNPTLPARTLYSGYTLALSGTANGTPPLTYQWLRNGTPISGQTSANLTINGVLAENAGDYQLVVTNPYGSATSAAVNVVVTPADSVAPTALYAAGRASLNKVRIWFSEPLDPTTAEDPFNYTIPGLNVVSATLVAPAGNVGDDMVELTTVAQTPGTVYNVTINNVKDQMLPATTIAPTTLSFSSWALAQGLVRFEHYDNIPSAADSGITAGLADPRVIAGTPTTLGALVGKFDTRTVFPDDSHENYMARMTGFITPKTTGDYYFFVASDDASRVYLSNNEVPPNPATDTPIVYELGCCGGFFEPDSGDTATTATPIRLVAGQKYAFVVLLKEGGGGDWLRLAWREANDPTPAASLAPIDGQFLSTYVDPNVDITFTKQPTDQPGILPSTAINFVNQSFASADGGFSVINTDPEPPGPWLYDPTSGTWSAEGAVDGCGGPYNSRLNSAEYTVPVAQAVTMSFSHRYSFEGDRWDGGQVRLSVNGGPFTTVPPANFTANGYAPGLVIQGNGVLKDQPAFMDNSPGYTSETFITSTAILGTFAQNDKIVVQFLGGWDDCSSGLHPSWQIKNLQLSYSSAPTAVTFQSTATASRQGKPASFTYQWQRNDGAGFVDIVGATGPDYTFFPTVAADMTATFRVLVGVPGKYVPSQTAMVVPPRPSLSFTPTATGISVSFTGTLQSAPSISGPFTNVGGASSPYLINASSGEALFFRSVQ